MTTPSLRRTTAFKAIDLPLGYAAIEELMRLLVKAVRAHQLYAANNPMHKAAMDALGGGFQKAWEENEELVFGIAETEVFWSGVAVLADPVKSSDSIAWMLYKDGVRELRLTRGVEHEDIGRFIEVVCRARKAGVDDDDLVTMLWEADFSHITYAQQDAQDGEDAANLSRLSRTPGTPSELSSEEVRLNMEQTTSHGRPSGVVNMADFDQTLHFLDEHELEYLRQEIAREYRQDLRTNIVSALLDVFEQQADDAIREECLDYVETMLAFQLAAGNFQGVAHLLAETRVAAARPGDLSTTVRKRIDTLADRLSAPDAVDQLLQSLDDASTLPPREELQLVFDQIRPAALGAVFAWMPRLRDDGVRALVADVAGKLASSHTAELVRLIDSPDAAVSTEAIRRAGALHAQVAVGSLTKVLGDPDGRRRLLAAQALAEIGSPGALQGLERALGDADRDVRITAMKAMALFSHRPAVARLETIIKGRDIRDADVTEKTAVFESYGALCGDAGVPTLDAVLNARSGLLAKGPEPSLRAAAAIGLGRIGSARAREALQKAAADKEPVVRNAVAKALRGGR